MKKHILSLLAAVGLTSFAGSAKAEITEYTYGSGDSSVPGGCFNADGKLLQSSLSYQSIIGDIGVDSFYRENSGYTAELAQLYGGSIETLGSAGLGGDGRYCVFPNKVTLQFILNATNTPQGFAISAIKTYASWDSDRSGQAYTVMYSIVRNPAIFSILYAVAPYNNMDLPTENYEREIYDDSDYELLVKLKTLDQNDIHYR
jgi:hypothetical protein